MMRYNLQLFTISDIKMYEFILIIYLSFLSTHLIVIAIFKLIYTAVICNVVFNDKIISIRIV